MRKMDLERFIEGVRNRPYLWDPSDLNYKNISLMDSAWAIIAEENNMKDGLEAKKRWKNLRDNLRVILKRQKNRRSGSRAQPTKIWKYQKHLEFLIPVIKKRGTESDLESLQSKTLNDIGDLESTEIELVEVSTPSKMKKQEDHVLSFLKEFEKKREVRSAQRDSERHKNMELKTDLQHFCEYIHSVLKKLPQSAQIKLKVDIFNLLTAAEENCAPSSSAEIATDHIYF